MNTPPGPPTMMLVNLRLTDSNADVLDKMRLMKAAREDGSFGHVICTIAGFDDDPRELADIPEARAFCRRLLTLGFPAYLDPCARAVELTRDGFGAAEVIWAADGRVPGAGRLPDGLVAATNAALQACRAAALAALGPFTPRA